MDKLKVGMHLKKDKDFYDLQEHDFAIYIGQNEEEKYLVGIKDWDSRIGSFLEYNSLEDLLKEWIID